MTLVNIVPHVILYQKTHVPWVVNFFVSHKASQHPVNKKGMLKMLIEQFALFLWFY